jgi:uncharacterized membrane protein
MPRWGQSSGGWMFATIVAVALLALCVAVSATVAFLAVRRPTSDARTDTVVRYFTLGAITTVGSSAMHMFAVDAAPSTVTLVFGDVAMMSGPAVLWVALRAVTGRSSVALVIAGVAAAFLAIVVATVPYTIAIDVRSVLLSVFASLALSETWRTGVRGHSGVVIIRIAMACFAPYMAAAAVVGTLAPDAALASAVFSFAPMTVVGFGAIGAVAVGALLLIRDLRGDGPRVPGDTTSVRSRTTVSIPDFALMPAAYGHVQAGSLERALLDAARSVDPAAAAWGPGAVTLELPDDPTSGRAAVRARFAALIAGEDAFVEPLVFGTAE